MWLVYKSKNDNGFELALIDSQHETIPNNYRHMTKGIILNFEVDKELF